MSRPTTIRRECDGCLRYAEVRLAAQPMEAMARAAYGRLRPAQRRQKPYLCAPCMTAFGLESMEDFTVRTEPVPDCIPEDFE